MIVLKLLNTLIDSNMPIIFMGVIGSGKTFRSNSKDMVKISVADNLREILWRILGSEPKDYDVFKKTQLDIGNNLKNPTGRMVLQNIGETFKNLFGRGYWAKEWAKKVREARTDLVCDDIRFPEEVEEAMKLHSTFIFCDYKSDNYEPDNKHSSERYAQMLLAMGYKDGEEIKYEDLETINNTFYE